MKNFKLVTCWIKFNSREVTTRGQIELNISILRKLRKNQKFYFRWRGSLVAIFDQLSLMAIKEVSHYQKPEKMAAMALPLKIDFKQKPKHDAELDLNQHK